MKARIYSTENQIRKAVKAESERQVTEIYEKAMNDAAYGAAKAGYKGAATSRGKTAVGDYGAALVRGNNSRAKGGIGAIIVIVNEKKIAMMSKSGKPG